MIHVDTSFLVDLLRDTIVAPAEQDRMIAMMGHTDVVDLDTGHMAMVTRPAELAAILTRLHLHG